MIISGPVYPSLIHREAPEAPAVPEAVADVVPAVEEEAAADGPIRAVADDFKYKERGI